jgi:hypothetical protein
MPKNTCTPAPLFFGIKKIKSCPQVSAALRHNKRAIQAELGAWSHIDSTKIGSNYCLDGFETAEKGYTAMTDAVQRHNDNHIRNVRHDAVFALEAVFSLPASRTDIDLRAFFEECLVWCKKEFHTSTLLSADVHMDEAHPHMHVLLGCVLPDRLIGSQAVGYSRAFNHRNLRFFEEVGKRHGLVAPTRALSKKDSRKLAHQVLRTLQNHSDPLLKSRCYEAIRKAIDTNPVVFAAALGIKITPSIRLPKKMRTSTQIFTSRGKGRNTEGGEPYHV